MWHMTPWTNALLLMLLLGAFFPSPGIHAVPDPTAGAVASPAPAPAQLQAPAANASLHCQYRQRQACSNDSQYLALCAIVRDQHDDLVEWIEHHLSLGVAVIYLYDHASEPPLMHNLTDYILAGVVEVFHITSQYVVRKTRWVPDPNKPRKLVDVQAFAYAQCMNRFRHRHQFIGFIDVDEFFILKNTSVKDMPTFLKPYEPYGGLAVHWVVFGTSGHLTRPANATLAAYTKCIPIHTIKTIANTCFATVPMGPHAFAYSDGAAAVTENGDRVGFPYHHYHGPLSTFKIALYHYMTKSVAEFEEKRRRGSGDGNRRAPNFLNATDATAVYDCTDAVELMKGRTWRGLDITMPGLNASSLQAGGLPNETMLPHGPILSGVPPPGAR